MSALKLCLIEKKTDDSPRKTPRNSYPDDAGPVILYKKRSWSLWGLEWAIGQPKLALTQHHLCLKASSSTFLLNKGCSTISLLSDKPWVNKRHQPKDTSLSILCPQDIFKVKYLLRLPSFHCPTMKLHTCANAQYGGRRAHTVKASTAIVNLFLNQVGTYSDSEVGADTRSLGWCILFVWDLFDTSTKEKHPGLSLSKNSLL